MSVVFAVTYTLGAVYCALLVLSCPPVQRMTWEWMRCRKVLQHLRARIAGAPADARVFIDVAWLNAQPKCVQEAVYKCLRDHDFRREGGTGSFRGRRLG